MSKTFYFRENLKREIRRCDNAMIKSAEYRTGYRQGARDFGLYGAMQVRGYAREHARGDVFASKDEKRYFENFLKGLDVYLAELKLVENKGQE